MQKWQEYDSVYKRLDDWLIDQQQSLTPNSSSYDILSPEQLELENNKLEVSS